MKLHITIASKEQKWITKRRFNRSSTLHYFTTEFSLKKILCTYFICLIYYYIALVCNLDYTA